ncbi:MAG: hypothetical protein AAB250_15125, partial [Bdellovibrionota bacterium]
MVSRSETQKIKFDQLVVTCDEMLRAGRIDEVIAIVAELNFAQIPRTSRQALAKIARRCGLIEEGLGILFPVIRDERPLEIPPTPSEICEYSVLLSRNGSMTEALSLLDSVDPRQAPEALLYQGFCHVSSWDYAKAKDYFARYLQTDVDEYSKLVARVNLAACLIVAGELSEAESFTSTTLEIALAMKATRLAGNCLELRAQCHLGSNDFTRASSDLDRAQEIFGGVQSYDQLLIEKWRSLIEASRTNSAAPIRRFRSLALDRRFWEFVRDADLLALKLEFDQRAFDHLIFGTPVGIYRERIASQLSGSPSPHYVWGEESSCNFVLEAGVGGGVRLNPGKKIHQLMVALLGDFYAPRRIGGLFAELYPEEKFDVHTSNLKIRQLMKRTRAWFYRSEIPLGISYTNGGYRLVRTAPYGIELRLTRELLVTPELRWLELRRH